MKREHQTAVKEFERVKKDLVLIWNKAKNGDWKARKKIIALKVYDTVWRHLFPQKNYALVDSLMLGYGVWLKNKPHSKEIIAKITGLPPFRTRGGRKIALFLLGLYRSNFSHSLLENAKNLKHKVDNAVEAIDFDKLKMSPEKIIELSDEELIKSISFKDKPKDKKDKKSKMEKTKNNGDKEKEMKKTRKAKRSKKTRKEQILSIIKEISDEKGNFLWKELKERLVAASFPSGTIRGNLWELKKNVLKKIDDDIYCLQPENLQPEKRRKKVEKKPEKKSEIAELLEVFGETLKLGLEVEKLGVSFTIDLLRFLQERLTPEEMKQILRNWR
jgi:FtsZ-interacting cell division protein YlmF